MPILKALLVSIVLEQSVVKQWVLSLWWLGIQSALREADEEIKRQHRELSGDYSIQVHRLNLEFQGRTEEAMQAVAVAESLSQQREQEVQAAREREAQQAEVAQVKECVCMCAYMTHAIILCASV